MLEEMRPSAALYLNLLVTTIIRGSCGGGIPTSFTALGTATSGMDFVQSPCCSSASIGRFQDGFLHGDLLFQVMDDHFHLMVTRDESPASARDTLISTKG